MHCNFLDKYFFMDLYPLNSCISYYHVNDAPSPYNHLCYLLFTNLPIVVISISLICTVSSDDRGLLSSICSSISFAFSYTLYAAFLKFNLNANYKTTHLVHIIFLNKYEGSNLCGGFKSRGVARPFVMVGQTHVTNMLQPIANS